MSSSPLQIVFVCGENACRSQMAEAFARQYGGDRVRAYSAGSKPRGQVDPLAATVMEEKGVPLQTHASKALTALPQQTWDVVVGMGCGDEACAVLPGKKHVSWQIPDPARHPVEIYRQVRDVIDSAVQMLLEQVTNKEDVMSIAAAPAVSAERPNALTMKGNPVTLIGPVLKPGDKAPDFQATGQDLSAVSFSSSKGKVRLISAVTSLDTGICDAETRRFNEEAGKLPNVDIWTISMDLPFAQKRWCGAAGVQAVKVVSDYKTAGFGAAYGVLIKELRLLARSIFVVDAADTIRYVEYLPENAAHPNYDAALAAVWQLAK